MILDDLCYFTEFYDSRANIEFRGSMDSDLGGLADGGSQGVVGAFRGIFRPK